MHRMRRRLTLANLLTLGSLTAGFLAALRVIEADPVGAAILIAVAALLDALDGPAARRRAGGSSEFGASLDSLADLVSFGMVPALALYLGLVSVAQPPLLMMGLAVCIAFVLCSALRLARFSGTRHPLHFVGLPTPPAGLALVVLPALDAPAVPAIFTSGLLCLLMISTARVPTLRGLATLFSRSTESEEPEAAATDEEARVYRRDSKSA